VNNKLLTVNNKMCQTGSRKCAADGTDIDQLHYLNAECPFWVFNYISMVSTNYLQFLSAYFTAVTAPRWG